jgi:hypothetical protein
MKPVITFLLVLFCVYSATSQRVQQYVAARVQYGVTSTQSSLLTFSDWNQLTPGDPNPDASDTTYQQTSFPGSSQLVTTFSELSLLFSPGIKPIMRGKLLPLIGVTLSGSNGVFSDISWRHDTRKRYDTLVSSQTGSSIYYLDSVSSEYRYKRYTTTGILMGIRLMLQTNYSKRWSMLFGLSFSYGTGKGMVVSGRHGDYSIETTTGDYAVGSRQYSSMDASYERRAPRGMQFIVSVPVALDFVLGKDNPFWMRTSIGLEATVGCRVAKISGYQQVIYIPHSVAVGIKYRLCQGDYFKKEGMTVPVE